MSLKTTIPVLFRLGNSAVECRPFKSEVVSATLTPVIMKIKHSNLSQKSKNWIVEYDDGRVGVWSSSDPISRKEILDRQDRDFMRDDGDERSILQMIPAKYQKK